MSPSLQCVNCTLDVDALFITYQSAENTAPIQCPRCGEDLDDYQTHQFEVVLVDLLLLRSKVFRHLLRNRGSGTEAEREAERTRSMLRLGAVVITLDAYVRTASATAQGELDSLQPLQLFQSTLLYCILETLSLHVCVAVSAWLLVFALSKQRTLKTCVPHFSDGLVALQAVILARAMTPSRHSLALLPLTLFYSFVPVLFLLCISSVWHAEYTLSPPSAMSALPHTFPSDPATLARSEFGPAVAWLASFSRENLRSKVSQVGNVTGWANDAVVRKIVGGSSAVIGIAALLDVSKRRAVLVLVVAWVLHLVVLHALDPLLVA